MGKKDLRATWSQALGTFLLPILLFLGFRWIAFEPYVIPSGSMIPELREHDNILVAKWSYGLRIPFTETWIAWWHQPKPGEIAVFRYPLNQDVFFVKRIIAVGGDKVEFREGELYINDRLVKATPEPNYSDAPSDFSYFRQSIGGKDFVFQRDENFPMLNDFGPTVVPEGHFFVVGDNRDHSSDSRIWKTIPYENLIGRPVLIWLSCNQTLPHSSFVCDPSSLRTERIGKFL